MTGGPPSPARELQHIAIVGAGIAGLTCARLLALQGMRVTVFERAAFPGGRLAGQVWDGSYCDLGAQFLTIHDGAFAAQAREWLEGGAMRRWEPVVADLDQGRGSIIAPEERYYVGVPGMQSLAAALIKDLDVVFEAQVGRIARGSAEWYLFDVRDRPLGIAGFDGLVLAVPSHVTSELLRALAQYAPEAVGDLVARLASVQWEPCWTTVLTLARPSGVEFDVAQIRDDPILVWAGREGSKPGREKGEWVPERWLLQARPKWSRSFARLAPDEAGRWMQRAFAARLGRPLPPRSCLSFHWPQAVASRPLPQSSYWDPASALGLAGDWCGGSTVEAAYLSGREISQAILGAG